MERKRIEKLVVLLLIGILIPVSLFPFHIYGAVQSSIVPTFSSSTSQWNGHLHITNFSDGTNNQASSTLAFTFDDDYYGIVYFDGYGPSNQLIANYASVYIAGGYGEYRYSYYQNGVINITSVTVNIVNVVKPDSSVDLTQIIQLLTSIETDTSSIDNLVDSTLSQIRNVLSQLIISNGYLETISKLRQYNFPIESYTYVYQMYALNYEVVDLFNYSYYSYPIFQLHNGDVVCRSLWSNGTSDFQQSLIIAVNKNIFSEASFTTYLQLNNLEIKELNIISRKDYPNRHFTIINVVINVPVSYTSNYGTITALADCMIIPIYHDFNSSLYTSYLSTDFALNFGLSNRLLDDLDIIANGTSQSSSASGSLDQTTSQFSDDANDLVTIEESFNNSMNQSLQSVNPTFNMGSSFLTSANWVSQQFNRIVNNTPFASLITFGLTLGLGLLIIGKVRK